MKKILGLLLALTLIVSGCNDKEENNKEEKKEEKEVVECSEKDIDFSYEEGEEKEFIENALTHYEDVRDDNGIYNVTSYANVRNAMLDSYEVYNSFQVFEDCVTVGMVEGMSGGYAYAPDDAYDSQIIYVIDGKDLTMYEFETDEGYDLFITDEFEDEDEFDKMNDAINVEILNKYYDDIVEAIEDERSSSFAFQGGNVVVSTSIDTKEYGEIPIVVSVSEDGESAMIQIFSNYNDEYLTDFEKDEAMEFYITYGSSNRFYEAYEELREQIKDFKD